MSSNQNDMVFFDENGLRTDQRRPDEIRPMKIKIGVLSRANGSCYLEWGANKVIAAVYGPREAHPRRSQRAGKALIRYRYNMQSFSVEDRARPGPSRRSSEISKVSREAFEPVVLSEAYPKAAIDIFVEVLQADAGTRTAAINAASLALVDAGIPMRGLVSACAVGKVGGKIVLDLNKPEDNYGEADLPIAMTEDGKITLIQMDGHLTPDEFIEAMELVQKGCRQVLEIQKAALAEKYASLMIDESDSDEIEMEVPPDEEDEDTIEDEVLEESDVTDEMVDDFVTQVSERLAKDVAAIIKEYEVGGDSKEIDLADGLFDDEDIDVFVIDGDSDDSDDELDEFSDGSESFDESDESGSDSGDSDDSGDSAGASDELGSDSDGESESSESENEDVGFDAEDEEEEE